MPPSHQSLKSDLSLSKPVTWFLPKSPSTRLIKAPKVILFEDTVTPSYSIKYRWFVPASVRISIPTLPSNPNNQRCFYPEKLWACLAAISLVWTDSISAAQWFLFSSLPTVLLIHVVCIINHQWLASQLKWRTLVSQGAPRTCLFQGSLNGSTKDQRPLFDPSRLSLSVWEVSRWGWSWQRRWGPVYGQDLSIWWCLSFKMDTNRQKAKKTTKQTLTIHLDVSK